MKRLLSPAAVRALALASLVATAPAFAEEVSASQSSEPSPPLAETRPSAGPSPSAQPPSAEPRSAEPPQSAQPLPPKTPAKSPPHFHRAPPSEPYRFSFGLAATLLFEMAPKLAPGATISAAFEINPGSLASPLWRLSLTHAQRRGLVESGGDAAFAFTLPTLDACPVRLGPRVFGVRPCVYASVGQLVAWGTGSRRSETRSLFYGAAGLAALVSWRVSEAFEIIADGRMGLPFRRDEFAFDGAVFFKTPTPGFAVSVGAAYGFP